MIILLTLNTFQTSLIWINEHYCIYSTVYRDTTKLYQGTYRKNGLTPQISSSKLHISFFHEMGYASAIQWKIKAKARRNDKLTFTFPSRSTASSALHCHISMLTHHRTINSASLLHSLTLWSHLFWDLPILFTWPSSPHTSSSFGIPNCSLPCHYTLLLILNLG